jgi:hypothetical protein
MVVGGKDDILPLVRDLSVVLRNVAVYATRSFCQFSFVLFLLFSGAILQIAPAQSDFR